MMSPINRRIFTSIRCPCHQRRRWYTSSNKNNATNIQTRTKRPKRGRLFFDRDYHIHLGGAIPPAFIADWIHEGHLALNDEIPDLVASSSSTKNRNIPMITVRKALLKYRGVALHPLDLKGHDLFLSAYNAPAYTSLPTFLTLYRAYSKRNLLYKHASRIARGACAHQYADIRVSIPHPNESLNEAKESPSIYAKRALDEMIYFHSCLLPGQKLFITFPRQTFSTHKNWEYFASFVDLLESTIENSSDTNNNTPWLRSQHLAFDFAGQPLPLAETLPLLDKLRNTFPYAFICYHHGEVCPHIPFSDRVRDTQLLLPYVNRIGHGLCLGLAVLGINPDDWGVDSTIDRTLLENEKEVVAINKKLAYQCLHQMEKLKIGIEVSPTCNITLGGARSERVLKEYVKEFLDCGVHVFVGTDDPGFLGTSLEKEIAILGSVDKECT
mmetsp:Transcript_32834/g.69068  ORF Transcript_32834/g.69068 Transcript_32834/m.69068 type:complete len:440 (+) Transcript_32834:163-1482(+)